MVLCLFAGGMAATAQPVLLLHATNTQWRYMAPTTDPGFGTDWKDPLFGDSGPEWSSGVGLFGTEPTAYPHPIRTPIPAVSGGGAFDHFYRAHFTWSGSTQGVLLQFTNYVDDSLVVFLNGTEIYRFNMIQPAGSPVQWTGAATATTANPGGEPVINAVTIDPTAPATGVPATLIDGDNVIAVYLGQAGNNSSDTVFGMWLYASQCIPATVQHPPAGGTNITVEECRNVTMTVQATGLPTPTYQWLHLGSPISGATGASLTVSNLAIGVNDGAYTVEVINSCGTATGSFNITVTPDTTAPTMVAARVNETRSQVTVSFSEPLAAPQGGDEFFFFIQENEQSTPINDLGQQLQLVNGTNIVIAISSFTPWVEGTPYRVFDQGGGARDLCKNFASPTADIPITVPFIVRQGLMGYSGAIDIEIHMNTDGNGALASTPNATAVAISVDQQDGSLAGVNSAAVGLLRFGDIFGNGPNQIPPAATIQSATLTLNQIDPGSAANAHRMLINWDANSTWNSFNNGVTNDGVEAMVSPDFTIPNAPNGARTFNVLPALQAWQGGQSNYGWVFLSTGTDGWDWSSSEAADAQRPSLTVVFSRPPDTALSIATDTPATVTANERSSFSISWAVNGNNPEFTWQRQVGSVWQDLPGTTATYTDSNALPSESGNYRSIACNSINCVTSRVTVVTVNPDAVRPTVSLVSVGQNRTTITLRFSEPVTSAGNYTISPNVGVNSATLGADNQTVTVETGPRTFRTQYTLNVSGAQDTAQTPNTMVATNITFDQETMIIAGFFEDWKYETNNLDGSAWTSPDQNTFDDVLWHVGPGIFGFEPGGAGSNTLRNAGLTLEANGYQPATRWDVNTNQPTYYVRKLVNVSLPTLSDVVFEMQHYIDDGAIGYVNGVESFRMGFTNGQVVNFATYSAGAPVGGEATLQTNILSGIVNGNNLVAVEIHQQNATSSDVVFGARIVARHQVAQPRLTITQSGANVTVSWTPAVGTLQESSDLVNWTTSSRANGVPAPATGNRFFRVLR